MPNTYIPKEITKDCDTGIEIAHFDYYTGIKYAQENNYKQTTNMSDIQKVGYFIVCCGDVMVFTYPAQWSDIIRRVF